MEISCWGAFRILFVLIVTKYQEIPRHRQIMILLLGSAKWCFVRTRADTCGHEPRR